MARPGVRRTLSEIAGVYAAAGFVSGVISIAITNAGPVAWLAPAFAFSKAIITAARMCGHDARSGSRQPAVPLERHYVFSAAALVVAGFTFLAVADRDLPLALGLAGAAGSLIIAVATALITGVFDAAASLAMIAAGASCYLAPFVAGPFAEMVTFPWWQSMVGMLTGVWMARATNEDGGGFVTGL